MALSWAGKLNYIFAHYCHFMWVWFYHYVAYSMSHSEKKVEANFIPLHPLMIALKVLFVPVSTGILAFFLIFIKISQHRSTSGHAVPCSYYTFWADKMHRRHLNWIEQVLEPDWYPKLTQWSSFSFSSLFPLVLSSLYVWEIFQWTAAVFPRWDSVLIVIGGCQLVLLRWN